jgi:26S proteasome regulatory subunit T4
MVAKDLGEIKYGDVGGLTDQIRDLRECIKLPINNPELFVLLG